jgi:hypothetical protein
LNISISYISYLDIYTQKMIAQNPLLLNEIVENVLNYLPLDHCKTVSKLWKREIDHTWGKRVKCLEELSFEELIRFYIRNSAWEVQVNDDLHRRQRALVRKYWDLVAEEKKGWKELNNAYDRADNRAGSFLTSEVKGLSEKVDKLRAEKREAFSDQVGVERFIVDCGFADDNEGEKIWRHITLLVDGFDPADVGWTETNETVYTWDDEYPDPLDYWGDEDPDI